MLPSASTVYFISEWVLRLVMLFVILRKRRPASALTWLLVIFFLPWPGLVLYIIFGSYRLPRRRILQHGQFLEKLAPMFERPELSQGLAYPLLRAELMSTVKLAQSLGTTKVRGGNDAELLPGIDELLDRMIADIDKAQGTVHALYYIYGVDEIGTRFAAALKAAAGRGVVCRLLVDSVGSRNMMKVMARDLVAAGVEVHECMPVGLFRSGVARWDLRNHRKLVVIDGRVAYTGSHNMIDPSYGHDDKCWHDLSLRIAGPAVLDLQAAFATDWHFETNELLTDPVYYPPMPSAGQLCCQVVPSGPNFPDEPYRTLIVAALHDAQERVTITTPYFIPDDAFVQAVRTAALRGVQVDIVVPRQGDQRIAGSATKAYYEDVLRVGAAVHLYEDAILHAKTMVIDDSIAFIGTSNFDIRSFELNFEINLVFYGPEMTTRIRQAQHDYLRRSTRLSAKAWSVRPARQKFVQDLARLLSPLL
jgi:cardiolipin synthase